MSLPSHLLCKLSGLPSAHHLVCQLSCVDTYSEMSAQVFYVSAKVHAGNVFVFALTMVICILANLLYRALDQACIIWIFFTGVFAVGCVAVTVTVLAHLFLENSYQWLVICNYAYVYSLEYSKCLPLSVTVLHFHTG